MNKTRARSVTEYINAAPKQARPRLRQIRAAIRKAAPGAVEGLKWRMPAHSYGRILIMYAAFTNHISLFPTGSAIKGLKKDLKGYKVGRGTIQLQYDEPLPLALVRKVTAYRVKELREKDVKWRS